MMKFLPKLLLLALFAFPATLLVNGTGASAQDLMEDEETEAADEDVVDDVATEDEDDEAEVEDDENVELTEEKEEEEEALVGEVKASPNADTTILFVKGDDFPANEIVKFLLGFSNKGPENFVVESLDASFRYPQDYQFYIQNFTALQLGIEVPASRQATFEYSFIPAEPMGGRPFGLVINLNYKDANHLPLRLPVGPRAAGRRRASPADRVQEEETPSAKGGDGDLQPQRRGPQLDPSGDPQPDQQSVSQKISSQEEPETLSRLGRVTVAMATVHRGRMKTGRVGTRSTERL
ncbi:translocon-associated protein subunit alpha isoform X7 [Gasterosteus aculeatus]